MRYNFFYSGYIPVNEVQTNKPKDIKHVHIETGSDEKKCKTFLPVSQLNQFLQAMCEELKRERQSLFFVNATGHRK